MRQGQNLQMLPKQRRKTKTMPLPWKLSNKKSTSTSIPTSSKRAINTNHRRPYKESAPK